MQTTATTGAQICAHYNFDDATWASLPVWERALYRAAYAADAIGVREGAAYDSASGEFTPGPPYNNVGPDVNRYLEAAGAEPGEPWCAAFGTCMLLDSGVARGDLPELAASVHGWKEWANAEGHTLDAPTRGCAGLIIESPTSGHFVLVSEVHDQVVTTIEGNTNPGGSREGYGVFRRARSFSQFDTWVDLGGF